MGAEKTDPPYQVYEGKEMWPVVSFIFSATPTHGESAALAQSSSKAEDSKARGEKKEKKILMTNWQTICLYVLSPYVTFTIFLFKFSLI